MNATYQNNTGNITIDTPMFGVPNPPCLVHACRYSIAEKVALVMSLTIVFLIILVGNALLCYFLIKERQPQNSSTWLSILNLAISDILIAVFCMPVLVVQIYTLEDWPFGETVCRGVPFVLNVAWIAAIINLTIISIELFMSVFCPGQCIGRPAFVKGGIIFAWLIAIADSGYYTYAAKKRVVTFFGKSYCIESWSLEENKGFLVANIAAFYFVPLAIILILHTATIIKLRSEDAKERKEELRRVGGVQIGEAHARRKAILVLLLIALSFLIFMTPFEVYSLIALLKPQLLDKDSAFHLFAVTLWLFFFNLATHPFIYGLLSPRFRQVFKRELSKLKKAGSKSEQAHSMRYQRAEQTAILCEHEDK